MRVIIIVLALLAASAFVRTPLIQKLLFAAIGFLLVCLLLKLVIRLAFRRIASRSDYGKRRSAEEAVLEEADWIGKTGLDEAIERELPRYLRRELREFLDDPHGLKASQLRYLGLLRDEQGHAHFWRLPAREHWSEAIYAYVEIDAGGIPAMGWGARSPGDQRGAA